MANLAILMGRLTRDPEVRYSNGEKQIAIARYTLAVDRRGKRNQDGEQTADFIPCVAFDRAGEFAEKYFRQGMRVYVRGHIQTGSYTNRDGQKVYTTEVIVDDQEFADGRRDNPPPAASAPAAGPGKQEPPEGRYVQSEMCDDDFMNIPEDANDTELPFN